MEHHEADVRQVASRGTAGDDVARFLRELRQLRDGAGLGHAELAARAHYPYDLIKAAEAGPSLPDLPVLSAYVRGCGGTTEEWEERWRTLTRTPCLPVPASRHAGNSDAATAGARIGAATQVVDTPDPSVIIAALSRVAEGMAVGDTDMDAAPPTVPPRPAFPADDSPAVSPPAVLPPADVSMTGISLADVPLPDVSLPDMPPPGVPLADAPFADAPFADAPLADAPFADAPFADVPFADAFAAAESPAGPAGPPPLEADEKPKGWDPIRVSAAWPAIGSEDPRETRVSDDTAASPSGASPADGGARPVIRQSAWARGVDVFGEPTGVARPGSRARTLVVAVVLVCVLAVLLAIFA